MRDETGPRHLITDVQLWRLHLLGHHPSGLKPVALSCGGALAGNAFSLLVLSLLMCFGHVSPVRLKTCLPAIKPSLTALILRE